MSSEPLPIVTRAVGITPTERYLHELCERSFLSLWSYPSIFRNQKPSATGDGKEVCDLLVVFGEDIVVFSDKSCAFSSAADIRLSWSRWFRKAVLASAQQAWGAERWIREHPDRLFLDRACTQPFPLNLPDPKAMRFHHIVVAHNISPPCVAYFGGGSGTLVFDSDITPEQQSDASASEPFRIGWFDGNRTFVHVLDDASLNILLTSRDTITDFVHYLRAKEAYLGTIRSRNMKLYSTGEEEFLAQYLYTMKDGEHAFPVPEDANGIMIPEGDWARLQRSPERAAQFEADKVSYSWDALIEKFNQNILDGTSYYSSDPCVAKREPLLRFFARESRVRRRILAEALLGLMYTAKVGQRANRIVLPSKDGDPHYCFLLLPRLTGQTEDAYRTLRREFLWACCLVVKLVRPEALDIIALATENDLSRSTRSEDALFFDAREWNEDLATQARDLQQRLGLFTNLTHHQETVSEFPQVSARPVAAPGPNPRNKTCPCGSGQKYKRCHGR